MKLTKKIIQKFFLIPQRYILAIMAFLAITNAYQLRICLNVTITEMVVTHHWYNGIGSPYYDPDACPDFSISTQNDTSLKKVIANENLFDWDEETQGLILSSFFWGYIFTHIPGGLLADKFGGKYVLGLGILTTSLLTLLIPIAANAGEGWLLATRIMTGLGEGGTFPAINALLARWIPLQERGLWGSLVFSGSLIGSVTGTMLSGYLLNTYKGDWPLVFYFFGVLGVLWWIFWTILCYSEPETHPFVTDEEKQFLNEIMGHKQNNIPPTPWRRILTSIPVWTLTCGYIGHNWVFTIMNADLPKYMKDVLKFSIGANGVLSSTPYILTWLIALSLGRVADQIVQRKWLTVTATRKFFTSIGTVGTSVALIGASYAGCDRTLVVILCHVTIGIMGAFWPGMKVNLLDLSPNYAATIMAIVNGIGAISCIITPYLVGHLAPNHALLEWRTVFWISAAVQMLSMIIFVCGASGEIQPWNNVYEEKKKKEEKNSIVPDVVISNERLSCKA